MTTGRHEGPRDKRSVTTMGSVTLARVHVMDSPSKTFCIVVLVGQDLGDSQSPLGLEE